MAIYSWFFDDSIPVYRCAETGFTWVCKVKKALDMGHDFSAHVPFSIHPYVFSKANLDRVLELGIWDKQCRIVNAGRYYYNIDMLQGLKDKDVTNMLLNECRCQACIERRDKNGR